MARRFQEAIAEHGPDSVALYVSGQLLTEDYYVANKLMKGFIGTANIDTNSRLCMASCRCRSRARLRRRTRAVDYEDLEAADLLVMVGSNLAWCHPVVYQRAGRSAEARHQGCRHRSTPHRHRGRRGSAPAIAPGSDVLLFNGLLAHWLRPGG